LKVSRLVLRRSVAQELCDAGLIFVNGSKAKASKEVKAGDKVEIRRRTRHTTVEVVSIPASKQVSKDATSGLYRMIEDIPIDDDPTN
jgi:ribosomal 50S subunit-recycling heat shock protein